MRRRLSMLAPADVVRARAGLEERLTRFLKARPGLWLGFRSMPTEPTLPLSVAQVEWAFPVANREDSSLRFYRWSGAGAPVFVKNAWSIDEPDVSRSEWTEVDPADDTVRGAMVPGLAFDRHLNRLGRGGGFYDRFLTNFRKNKTSGSSRSVDVVGVGFAAQVIEEISPESHDVDMDGLMTDRECWWRLKGRRHG